MMRRYYNLSDVLARKGWIKQPSVKESGDDGSKSCSQSVNSHESSSNTMYSSGISAHSL